MPPTYFVVYLSPNGSTQTVATALANKLKELGQEVIRFNLAEDAGSPNVLNRLTEAAYPCLCIGSPVYRDMAVAPVMDFINGLNTKDIAWAVPFVTWGAACSGVALWQMGGALLQKGYQLAAAAKVGAVHSMMWQLDPPPANGRPHAADIEEVKALAVTLTEHFSTGRITPLPLETLDYQTPERAAEFKAKLEKPKMIIPKILDENACTQCGTCVEECPVGAVVLDPTPEFNDDCIDCFNCIRLCPEAAIEPKVPLKKIEEMVLGRVNTIQEKPLTRVYWG
jgi:ferredoxin